MLFIGCDQFTKELAKQHLKDKPELSFYHDMVRLVYVENTGAFLSFGDNWPPAASFWLMNVLPLLFLMALFIYAIRKMKNSSFCRCFRFYSYAPVAGEILLTGYFTIAMLRTS